MNARPANRRLISRAAPVLLALVGLAILFAAVPTTAESSGPGKPPDTPEGLEGTAIFVGGVDLEWTDVPGAESYEVQLFRNVQWIDLPGDGVEIAFYGAGAIISQLNHDGYTYWFQVRANNAKGSSEWSDPYLMQPTYHFEAGRKERPENVVATGAPTISGTAQVGKVLTADASGIEDGNGLDRVKFQYQWVSNDGTTDTDIEGATESAYRLQAADEGKTLKVRGSFIDRHGYAESLTSAATPAALESAANIAPTGAPAISGPTHVSGTLTASVQGIDDQNGLRHAAFRYRWTATEGTIETVVQDSEKPIYVLAEADEGKTVQVDATFTDDDGYEETLLSVPTGAIGPRPNRPATGEPTINGTVQVGETLTADTSGIKDADGINRDRVRFQFKWIANDGVTDTELSYGPGNSGFPNYTTYTLTVDDAGKTIRVQVEFNDGRGHRETVTSAPSPQVSPGPNIPATGVPTISGAPKVGRTLTVDASGISDPNGLDPAAFSHQWVVSDGATDTYIAGADDSTYTAIADDTGKTIHVRVTFTDKGGYQESVTSAATVPVFETDDHGDTPETATPLPVDIPNSNPTQGTVYPRDDYDYFRLEVTDENSGYIKVSFYEWEDSDPDPSLFYARLALFNGDGTCVTRLCDLDNGTDAGYLQAYVQPGVYYLRITGPHHDLDTDSVGANRGYYVFWARDQHYYDRLEECRDSSSGFDDPLFGCQGHLKADDDYDEYPGSDINVVPAWEAGHFGAGINVVVVDTGIDDQHQDLVGVVVVGKSGKTEHLPRLYDPRSQHGTKVAGIIAAQHNTVGVRGIAPEATIYSFRLFQDSSFREWSTNPYESRTSQTLGDPLTLHHTDVAVSNNSWGTGLLGYVPGEMDELRTQSLLKGINEGFHGKGTLYVFSAIDEDGNLWELSSHYAVIQVCGVGPDGKKSIHEGHGYNLWMCAPLGGYTTHNNNYYGGAVGTSFSAPHVSGVAALVRSADMELTWRDVKLILAGSAVKNDPDHAGWEAGALKYGSTTETYSFNPNYGFGVVDAKAAVDLAATWTNLPPMQTASANSGNTNLAIPDPPNSGTPTTVETSVTLEDDGHSTPLFTEHVEIEVKFDHPSFRDLDVELVSPTGTVSKLASHDNDLRGGVFDFEYSFGSSKHLGENPVGTWTLRITDHVSRYQGQLKEWSVIVRGHRPEAVSGPHIVGTPQVRETLTVDTSGIDDEDGLVNVSFSYQWLANDAEIVGATDPTYTLVDDDAGLTIKVQVSFFDDKNNPDTLTSAATTAVLANVPDEPEHLNVSLRDTGALDVSWEAPASDGGSAITEYRVQWKEIAGNWDAPADVSEETATGTTHTITGLTDGVEYAVRVIVANNVGEGPPSDEATGTPRETTPPELSTATVDGATLTLTYDEDLDENSEPSSDAFSVTVVGTGRAVDGVSVSGSSVILTLGSVVTSEDTVTVSYTVPTDAAAPQIQDDAGNPAASFSDQDVEDNTPPPANTPATGAPTITGTAQVGDTLTVETSAIDDADGLDNVGYSYQWLADDTEIAGATDPTYTLVDADAGLTIKVKVSFFDDKNNPETLTSAATAAVQTQEPNSLPTVTGPTDVDYAENSVSSVATYIAVDPEGEAIKWSVSGTDHVLFSITSGVLELLTPPNYENPIDEGEDNGYLVDVTATDSSGAAVTIAVTVTVTDVYDPNIVLVMADEGGYELFGAYGSTQYRTPRIDEIAAAGVRFTHAYSKPGSTPSRVALMTGKSNVRNYVDWGTLLPGEYTIADLFSDAGYATAIAGKWQLQGRPNYITGVAAEESGFDTYCLWYSDISERRYWQPTFECDGQVIDYAALDYGPDELVDFLDGFIESNQDKPFFAYYSMLLPHAPFDALPPTAQCVDADNAQCVFEDMVAYMDYNVGRIYDKLESLGLLDNTVFLFTSDNGTPESKVSHLDGEAIHGEKGEPTDGSTHVPLIVHAPGATGGQVIDDLIDFTDFLPTLADAAGLTLPADVTVDGQSFWDRLQGGSGNLREWIYTYYFPEPYTDRWNFPREHPEVAYVRNKTFKLYASGDLYDLSVDRHEVRPLAEDDEDSRAARAALQAVLDSMPEQGQEIVWDSVLTPPPATEPRPRWRPVLRSATVNGAELSLAYAGGLKTQANPGSDAFSVEVEGTGRTVTSVSLTEEEVTLTLASAVTVGQTVTVSYTPPSEKPLRRKYQSKGNKAAALTEEPVRNDTGLAPPTFTATGAPSIGGTAQVGETLTVDTSGIDDEDGLANVSFSYQWLANDAEIVGATDPTYTLVDDDAGLTIKVQVSFFDDKNNQETLTSEATATVVTPLTAGFRDAPPSHNGSDTFTFRIAFSEPISISYKTLRDDSLDVTNGSATKAKRVDGQSDLWEITVEPDSNAAVTVVLPITEDCAAQDAVCTRDGTELSNRSELTVLGPAAANSPATGAPIISGTARVGETLTVDTSGIEDADGMSGAVFSYQWLADGVEITGATGDTYTLVEADFDKAVKVRVIFNDDDANEETLTSEATASVAPRPNTPATGLPTISGTAQVGETLTADISGIGDDDGLDNATFSYQWIAGTTDIAGATDLTYTLVADDVGKAIRVRVSFDDDLNFLETLTSEATATVVTPLTAGFRDAPPSHNGSDTFTFRIAFSEPISIGYVTLRDDSLEVTNGSATKAKRVNGQSDLWEITVEPDSDADVTVVLPITKDCAAQDAVCTRDGTELSNRSELTVPGPAAANSPPTGAPIISGTAQVGETLTVDTSGIDDADGMSGAVFSYQWLANDAEITGATGDTYTLVEADFDKAVKVRVIFNDDDNNEETLTSPATAAVAAEIAVPDAPRSLNVSPDDTGTLDVSWEAPASDGGSAITGYKVQWKRVGDSWDTPADVFEETVSRMTHTITGLTDGVEYAVRVIAVNDVGDGPPSDEATRTPRETTPPELATATVDETTLTLTYDEDLDENSEPSSDAFSVTVGGTGRAVDGVSVSGSSVILTLGSAVASGATVTVSYAAPADTAAPRIQDDAGNPAASFSDQAVVNNTPPPPNTPATGAPTISGTARVGETLTAETSAIADADGLDNVGYSYQWLANGADIAGATDPTYTLVDDDAGLTIQVKVSFRDDKNNPETLTSAATAAVEPRPNSPATGAPTISGTVRVGETLTAGTSAIADADGMSGAVFIYQWLADNADIAGATNNTYTLVDADLDKPVKVRVIFTDNADNEETLTSAATAAVEPRPNSPATGAPTISGTAQVGETLTVDMSGIDDADGMSGAVFSYQWLADDADIAGATNNTYTLVDTDVGKTIKARVIFTDNADNEETLISAATAAVEPRPNSPATGAPTISGTAQVGETLTVDTSDIADADGMSGAVFSYQWLANGADVAGATSDTYTPVADDVGKAIKVKVSFRDDRNHQESLTSAATAAVTAAADESAVWSATLTVGSSGSFHGYWNDLMGSLAPDGFNIDGSDYTVISLINHSDLMFAFVLDQALPGDFTLQVGDTTLRSEEADVNTSSSSYSYQWQNKIPALSDGDIVEVSLTLDE